MFNKGARKILYYFTKNHEAFLVNGSIRLMVQYLAGPNAEPLTGFDCSFLASLFIIMSSPSPWFRQSESGWKEPQKCICGPIQLSVCNPNPFVASLLPSFFVIGNAIFRRRAKSSLMTLTIGDDMSRGVSCMADLQLNSKHRYVSPKCLKVVL